MGWEQKAVIQTGNTLLMNAFTVWCFFELSALTDNKAFDNLDSFCTTLNKVELFGDFFVDRSSRDAAIRECALRRLS